MDSVTVNSASTPPIGRTALRAIVLLGAVAAIYAQTVGFDLLHWDDNVLITENALLRTPSRETLRYFWQNAYAGLYMPVTYTFWLAEGAVASLFAPPGEPFAPWVFHLGNVLLFAGIAWQVHRLLVRIVGGEIGPLLGTLLFVVHPVQVESVAWVSETKGLLSALLGVTALVAYIDAARSTSWMRLLPHYALATAAFVLAILSKPSAVAVPLMATVIGAFCLQQNRGKALAMLLPWYIAAAAGIAWTSHVQEEYVARASLLDRPWIALDAYTFYLRQLVFVDALGPDYGRDPATVLNKGVSAFFDWRTGVALLVLLIPLWKRPREILAAHLIFLAGLLPVLGLIPFGFQSISTVADRYMLLAMLGPALGVATVICHGGWILRAIVLVALAAMATFSHYQARHWKDDAALIKQALHVNPNSPTFLTNRAVLRLRDNDLSGAIDDTRRALQNRPTYMPAFSNLAAALYRSGDTANAIATLQQAIELRPDDTSALTLIAALLAREGRYAEAVAYSKRNVEKHPDSEVLLTRLATYLILNDQAAEGLEIFRATLNKELSPPEDRLLIAQVHEQAGLSRRALTLYQAILDEEGNVPGAKLRIAWILATDPDPALRDPVKSLQLCRQITRGSPDGPAEVLDTIAAAQAALGKFEEAALTAERAADRARQRLKGDLMREIEARRALYEQGQAFIQKPLDVMVQHGE